MKVLTKTRTTILQKDTVSTRRGTGRQVLQPFVVSVARQPGTKFSTAPRLNYFKIPVGSTTAVS
eukprot:SAG31_NODE_668_length_12945_cov_15.915849_6_plen_64_part_00